MSWLSNVKDALLGNTTMSLPAIDRLSAAGGTQVMDFVSLDDPGVIEYLRGNSTQSATGISVNEKLALRNSAVHRAVHLIAGSLGMLPLELYQKIKLDDLEGEELDDDEKAEGAKKAKDHPVYRILKKRPNKFMTPYEFKNYMVTRALFDGICYAHKRYVIDMTVKGGRRIDALIPLDPKSVTYKIEGDDLVFTHKGAKIPSKDMFWFRSPVSSDGITGTKLVEVALETIALASQSEEAAAKVLKNGALVGGVLSTDKPLSQPAVDRLRAQFEERQASPKNAGKWIVAEDGLQVSINNASSLKDAQNVENRKFQIEEVGRFTNVPRPLLFMDDTSWGSGIEVLGLFFITYCLLSWFQSIEEAIARSLLSEEEADEYYAKFNDGALLRGSLESQANFFSKALGAGGGKGWMTQNEVRGKFELNPKEGGNDLPQPAAKVAADAAGQGDDGQEPDAGGAQPAGKPAQGPNRSRRE